MVIYQATVVTESQLSFYKLCHNLDVDLLQMVIHLTAFKEKKNLLNYFLIEIP